LFWEVLDEPQQIILRKLAATTLVAESYLAGGTGLALLIGHRQSLDFDWFIPVEFDPGIISEALSCLGEVVITETGKGTFHGLLNGTRVTWLWYPNPLLEPPVTSPAVPGLKVASLTDIALMKWTALSQRGSRKDFIDLYFLCQKGLSLAELIMKVPQKYPEKKINHYHMIKSLSYFDDARREAFPVMKTAFDWNDLEKFFIEEKNKLLHNVEKGLYLD
jgi:hypothetical protein